MARVNITIPDALLDRARAVKLNVSQLAAAALADELDRRARIAALEGHLRELEAELGPPSADEQESARQWADRALGGAGERRPGRQTRTA